MRFQLLRTKLCFSKYQFRFRQSTTNRYRSIPIYLSIGIDNRYQSITTLILAIDWSSIINISRLIDIDWYRLISIIIDYPGWYMFDIISVQIKCLISQIIGKSTNYKLNILNQIYNIYFQEVT